MQPNIYEESDVPIHPEHLEAQLASLHGELIQELRRAIRDGDALPGHLEVARKILIAHKVTDPSARSPVKELARELPFSSVEQELE